MLTFSAPPSQTIRFCGCALGQLSSRPRIPLTLAMTTCRTSILLAGGKSVKSTISLRFNKFVRRQRCLPLLRRRRSRPPRTLCSTVAVGPQRAVPPMPTTDAGTSRTRRKSRGSPLGVHRRPRLLAFRHWIAALPVERRLPVKPKKTSTSRRSLRRRLVRSGIRCRRMTTRDRCCCDLGHIAPLSSSFVLPARVLVTRPTRTRRSRLEMTNATRRLACRRITVTITKPRYLAPPLCPLAAVNRHSTPFPLLLPSPIPIPTRSLQRRRTERRLWIRTRLRSVVGAATGTTRGGVEVLLPGGWRESRTVTVPFFVDVREEVRRRRDLCALRALATMTRAAMTTAAATTTSGSGRVPPLPRIGLLLPPHRLRHSTTHLRCTTTTAVPVMRLPPPQRRLRVASTCSERPTPHGPPRVVRWSALDHR